MWFIKEVCQNAYKKDICNNKKYKKIPISSVRSPPPSKNLGYATVVPLYSKWKVGASASVCRVTLCVYCWVHFVTIAKMYGIACSVVVRVKSCLGLDKKVLFTSLLVADQPFPFFFSVKCSFPFHVNEQENEKAGTMESEGSFLSTLHLDWTL